MNSFFGFASRNAAVIVSLCSMGVAVLSLSLTFIGQRNDLIYREANIRPMLSMTASEGYLSLTLHNKGLGPALIKDIRFSMGEKCYSGQELEDGDYTWLVSSFLNEIADDLYGGDTFGKSDLKLDEGIGLAIEYHLPAPGTMIRAGEDFSIIKVNETQIEEINRRLMQINNKALADARRSFALKARQLPLGILYCSATEATCDELAAPKGACSR